MNGSIACVVTCISLFGCILAPTANAQTIHVDALHDSVDRGEISTDKPHGLASWMLPSLVAPVAYCDEPIACDAAPAGFCGGCGSGRCSERIWCREKLTGDWLGRRGRVANHGIDVESTLTQFYQGVSSGGRNRRFRYGSKFDLYFNLDTEKLGLWKGGKLQIHGVDWNFGQNSVADASFLAPVNASMLYPKGEPSFGVTSFFYEQELGGGYAAMVGRYNLLDLWLAFFPDYGRGVDGFMNVSSFVPFSLVVPVLPTISNVAGIVKAGDRGLQAGFLALETQTSPTTIGLDFPNGVTLVGFGRAYTDFGGLPGSHLLAGTYATGDFSGFDGSGWITFPANVVPVGPAPTETSGTWSVAYIGEQRLWEDPCNAKRYSKLLAYVDVADDRGNPFSVTAGAALEAFGRFQSRPNDRMGIAYFYNALNTNFQRTVSFFEPAQDVHGGEFYYNAEITPWFHLTSDLQAVNTTFRANDTAVVLGLRAKLDF